VTALSPSAAIGLRDALTGEARATRVRQLATPSWLSTRQAGRRAARGASSAAPASAVRTASSTWSALPRPEVVGFSRLRSRWCRREQDDFVVRAVSLRTTAPSAGSLRERGEGRRDLARAAEFHAPNGHADHDAHTGPVPCMTSACRAARNPGSAPLGCPARAQPAQREGLPPRDNPVDAVPPS
jgi:hypothetical protein